MNTGARTTNPQPPDLLPNPVYLASLPKLTAAAAVLLRDEQDRFLAVKPNYRDHWLLPGGSLDPGEDPRSCAAREVREEVGLDLPIGRLLAVDWVPPRPRNLRAMGLHFVFDAGVLPHAELQRMIVPQAEELDEWAMLTLEEAPLLSSWGEQRVHDAYAVLRGEAEVDVR